MDGWMDGWMDGRMDWSDFWMWQRLLISSKLSFAIVGLKMSFLRTLALKSLKKYVHVIFKEFI
jgi:hypothetical protein